MLSFDDDDDPDTGSHMNEDAFSPARLADRARIEEVLLLYARAIDRQDLVLLAERVFHEDAVIDNGAFQGHATEFIAMVRERHAPIPQAFHMAGQGLIEFLADGRAFVESYCLALEHHADTEGGVDRIVRVRYADLFESRAGRWKIARRSVVMDHEIGLHAAVRAEAFFGGPRLRGVRGEDDPIERLRKAL